MENIKRFEFAPGNGHRVYITFFNARASLKAMRSSYIGRQHSKVPVEKWQPEISLRTVLVSPSMKRT